MGMADLTGKRFGRWVVIKYDHTNKHREPYWECKCECGTTKVVLGASLKNGNSRSCGCLQRDTARKRATTHGMRFSRIHGVWAGMIERCENPKHKDYKSYGGRGIKVCEEWRSDFSNFQRWAYANGYDENAPTGKCTIDRIDVNSNYCPSNCRWVDMATQSKNKRRSGTI